MTPSASPTAVEDYVKVIYSHTEWQSQKITASVLATRLGLAASSVTEMVQKLVAKGLVAHVPYGAIELTTDGTALALRMLRRHRLIETWLVAHFGYSWDEVHNEAEILEHSISDRLLDAIDGELGHPERDPHGDPIPARDGTVVHPCAVLLRDAPAGSSARVVRISDRDPTLLRHLEAESITIDSELIVVGGTASTASFTVRLAGLPGEAGERNLDDQALGSIWVSVSGA